MPRNFSTRLARLEQRLICPTHRTPYICADCEAERFPAADERDLDRLLDAIDADSLPAPISAEVSCPRCGSRVSCLDCQPPLTGAPLEAYVERVSRLSDADQTRLADLAEAIVNCHSSQPHK